MQPINYNLDVKSPFDAATEGYQNGFNQELAQYQLGQQLQQQKQASLANQQMQADLNALSEKKNPTLQDYSSLIIKYPHLSDHVKRATDISDTHQQRNRLSQMSQAFSAIQSGNPKMASELLDRYAQAYENSGRTEEANEIKSLNEQLKTNPNSAALILAAGISSVLGPDKFVDNFSNLQKLPGDLAKSQAEAEIKGVEAQAAPENIALSQANLVEDIEKKRLDRKLNVIDAQIKKADSETRRGELQVARDKAQLERDKLNKEDTSAPLVAQDRLDTVNNSLQMLDAILDSESTQTGFASGPGSVLGAGAGILPWGTNRRSLQNLIEPIKSQQFLTALQSLKSNGKGSGLGNLSNAEGQRLETAIAKLDPNDNNFEDNVKRIRDVLEKLQQRIIAEGNLPTENKGIGNKFIMNHPKFGEITDAIINKMLIEKRGSTRQQIMDYLRETGGQ